MIRFALIIFLLVSGCDSGSSGNVPSTMPDGVQVTYLGNDGVMLAFKDTKILIDAVHTNSSPWVELPSQERIRLLNGQAPYDGIDLVLVTHNHGDHFSPSDINTVLSNNPGARYVAPPSATGGITSSRVESVGFAFGQQSQIMAAGVSVQIFHMHHFDQFGNDFSQVQNNAYLITLGGITFLHVGDVEYAESNFTSFNLADQDVDVAFIPTFNTLISQNTKDLVDTLISPAHVVAMHFLDPPNEAPQARQLFPDAELFTDTPRIVTY